MIAVQPIAGLALDCADRRSIISKSVLCEDRRPASGRCLNRTLLRRALRWPSSFSISCSKHALWRVIKNDPTLRLDGPNEDIRY
jgi:hypothetical protein